MFVGASNAARPLLGFRNLCEAGLDDARSDALRQGRAETPIGIGHMVLQRVGAGADVGLVALLAPAMPQAAPAEPPHAAVAPATEQPIPDYAQPANSGEAPAEFALVDEFAGELPAATVETASTEPAPEPVAPAAEQSMPDYEQPANSGEAPAEFALVDEFAGELPAATVEAASTEPAPEPVAPAAEQPMPGYEQPANSGEAPAEFALIEEAADEPEEPAVEPVGENTPQEPDLPTVLQPDLPHLEASPAEAPAEAATPESESSCHEPSPYVEAVADEPAVTAPPWLDESAQNGRRHPLRFMWQMDAEGRFSLGSDEFTHLIGARTAACFGRLWSEIADCFGLDPEGRVLKAVATRDTWSGITLNWPADGGVVAGGIVGLADLRSDAEFYRLSGLWRLPRSRRPDAARGAAPFRIVQRPTAATNAIGGHCSGRSCERFGREFALGSRYCVVRSPNRPPRLLLRLHRQPIWKPPWITPWKHQRTSCRFDP